MFQIFIMRWRFTRWQRWTPSRAPCSTCSSSGSWMRTGLAITCTRSTTSSMAFCVVLANHNTIAQRFLDITEIEGVFCFHRKQGSPGQARSSVPWWRPSGEVLRQTWSAHSLRSRLWRKSAKIHSHFASRWKCGICVGVFVVFSLQSCPAINVYSDTNLDFALNAATCSYCQQEVKVYEVQRRIVAPALFQWYCQDFGNNDVEALRYKSQTMHALNVLRSWLLQVGGAVSSAGIESLPPRNAQPAGARRDGADRVQEVRLGDQPTRGRCCALALTAHCIGLPLFHRRESTACKALCVLFGYQSFFNSCQKNFEVHWFVCSAGLSVAWV